VAWALGKERRSNRMQTNNSGSAERDEGQKETSSRSFNPRRLVSRRFHCFLDCFVFVSSWNADGAREEDLDNALLVMLRALPDR